MKTITRLFILWFLLQTQFNQAQTTLCPSTATSFCCEYVQSVTFNGVYFQGNTGFTGPGYYDYTSVPMPILQAGTNVPLSVVVVTNGPYQQYVKFWIDFNNNGNLEDPGELVFDQTQLIDNTTYTFTGNIAVPPTAFNGPVRMRLIMVYANVPQLCGEYAYGNTFDFGTSLQGGVDPLQLTVNTTGTGSVASNPSGINTATGLNFANFGENTNVTLTATPIAPQVFTGWSGAASGTTNPLTVTMDQAKTITANFASNTPPTVTSLAHSNLTSTSVTLSANITSEGSAPITSRGFYYGTTNNPTTNLTTVSGTTGSMTTNIIGLQPYTTYYYRAFATNSVGTTFTTSGTFTTNYTCAVIDQRNNGNGQANLCAGIDGTQVNPSVIGTSYATAPTSNKTGTIRFKYSSSSLPGKIPAINRVWINGVQSTVQVGPPSVTTTQGSDYLVSYCFYNVNLPTSGSYTLEYVDPNTNEVMGRCTFSGSNTNEALPEPTLTTNTNPTISVIQNLNYCEGTTNQVNFTIADTETLADLLVLSATSSNTSLLPVTNITFSGTGSNRTANLQFVSGQVGSSNIIITVQDENGGFASSSFTVNVLAYPSVSYTQSPYLLYSGNSVGSITPTNTGGTGTSWTITPALPTGLSFNTSTGAITGIPTDGFNEATFQVTASNGQCTGNTTNIVLKALTCNLFDSSDFTLRGNAVVSGTQITLTPAEIVQFGALWGKDRMKLSEDFRIKSQLYFGNSDAGADGLAFVIQTLSSNQGSGGGGLGYAGINPSLAVEFDTYFNPPGDPFSTDHMAIMLNGDTSNHANLIDLGNIEDDAWHDFEAHWTASTNNLKIYYDGVLRFNTTIDMVNNIFSGNENAYFGFTAATGGSVNVQAVRNLESCYTSIVNQAPTVTSISNQTNCLNQATPAIAFTIGDDTSPVNEIQVSGTSTNTTLVPNGNILFGGSGANRTVTVTPITGQFGTTTITISVTDLDGATTTTSFNITFDDTVLPTVLVQNITVQLDGSGNVTILPSQVNNGSTDNCAIADVSVSPSTFNGTNLGDNTVTLTITDERGNVSTQTATVTVEDVTPPTLVTTNSPNDPAIDNYTCGAIYNFVAGPSSCVALVSIARPVWTDNVGVTSTTQTASNGVFLSNLGDIVFGNFPVGTTVVTFTASDSSGNITTCTLTIVVTDTQNPTITGCPNNIVTTNTTGTCERLVNLFIPTAGDNCSVASVTYATTGATTLSGNEFPNALVFNVGITTLVYTVTDASGNQTTCTYTVTVNDIDAPVITCPVSDQNLVADAGFCSYTHNSNAWNATSTDNCSSVVTYVLTGATAGSGTTLNGVAFNVGTTTVTWTATDGGGNTDTCSFNVIVADTQDPVISNTPSNIVVNNDATICGAVVSWIAPTAADNCAVASLVTTHPIGSTFPVGTTTVTYTATDINGNDSTSSFTVTVNDTEDPVISNTPTNITTNNDLGNCSAVVTWTAPTAADNCAVDTFVSTHNPGDTFPVGTTTVTYTATDIYGNDSTSSFTVTVNDTEDPVISATPGNITVNNDLGNCSAVVTWTAPTAADNCAVANFVSTHNSGATFPVGTTTVTYTATDIYGNDSTSSFTVTVNDTQSPILTDPLDVFVNNDDGSCYATVLLNNPAVFENCETYVLASLNMENATNNQNLVDSSFQNNLHSIFTISGGQGVETFGLNKWYLTRFFGDAHKPILEVNLNSSVQASAIKFKHLHNHNPGYPTSPSYFAQLQVDVSNTGNFVNIGNPIELSPSTSNTISTIDLGNINLPIGIHKFRFIPLNLAYGTNTNTEFFALDDIELLALNNTSISNDAPINNQFPIGVTNVTWTATDSFGNSSSEVQAINVTDTELPVVLTQNITVELNSVGEAVITAAQINNGSSDNCGIASIVLSQTDFDCSHVGANTVTLTVTDVHGNENSATAVVTVEDNIIPVIICPADIVVNTPADMCGAIVEYNAPIVFDNCGTPSETPILSIPNFTYAGTFGESHYFLSNNPALPEDAYVIANSIGGHLATIGSAEENAFVSAISPELMWIGFTDRNQEGQWEWVTGEPVTYTNWNPGEPNNAGDEDWVSINYNGIGGWNDFYYTESLKFVVEFSTNLSTIPSTLVSGPVSGSEFPVGTTTITYSATDAGGNTVDCSFTVTVVDNVLPTATINPVTLQLGADGTATLNVAELVTNASDNCEVANIVVSKTEFDCEDIIESNSFAYGLYPWDNSPLGDIYQMLFDENTQSISYSSIVGDTNLSQKFGIDYHPLNNKMYILGGTNAVRGLYELDLTSFNLTPVISQLISSNGNTNAQDFTINQNGEFFVVYNNGVIDKLTLENTTPTFYTNVPTTGGAAGLTYDYDNNRLIYASGTFQLFEVLSNATVNSLFSNSLNCTAQAIEYVGNGICMSSSTFGCNVLYRIDLNTQQVTILSNGTLPEGNLKDIVVVNQPGTSIDNTYPITVTVTDVNNNSYVINTTVIIEDNLAPVVTCVSDQVVSTDINTCTYTHATDLWNVNASDNCTVSSVSYELSGATTGSGETLNGVIFNLGETTVLWTVVDNSGNVSTCSYNISVEDTQIPVITCVENKAVNTDLGLCTYTNSQNWNVQVADNCNFTIAYTLSGATIGSGTDLSGVAFNVGTTIVNWLVVDSGNNEVNCNFEVVVTDNQLPLISNTPGNITVNNDLGNCSAVVTWTSPTAADNCAIDTFTSTHSPGATFPVGTTTVTYTATDIYGNVSSTQFDVIVQDLEAPVVTCIPDTTVSTDLDVCTYTIPNTSWDVVATDNCTIQTISYVLSGATTASGNNSIQGLVLNLGTTTITWTVVDIYGNDSVCSYDIEVEDNQAPSVTSTVVAAQPDLNGYVCGDTFTFSTQPTNCFVTKTIAKPTWFDNCDQNLTLAFSADNGVVLSNIGDLVLGNFPLGTTTVTFSATDFSGNTTTCEIMIEVEDQVSPTLANCPTDMVVSAGSSCNNFVNLIVPFASDNCTIATITYALTGATTATGNGFITGYTFNLGITTVTYEVVDLAGNVTTCTFTVEVEDQTAPVITTQDLTTTITQGCSMTIALNTTATDDCGSVTLVGVRSDNLPLNDPFAIGVTTITWTATDGSGNVTTVIQTVTIIDNTLPVVTAPADVTVNVSPNSCIAFGINIGQPVVSDNCGTPTVTSNAPAFFAVGTTVVTWTVTDSYGNTVTVTQNVTVVDNLLPIVSVPGNITVNANQNCMATNVAIGQATAQDNCGVLSITNNAPNVYPLGVTNITWTVTDVNGNVVTAVQTVTVIDATAPSITAPSNITLNANANCVANNVNIGFPVTSDNCSNVTITNNAPTAFPVGVTMITWTATDAAGNVSTATQMVTVLDVIAPVATAPANVTANADANSCFATNVNLGTPVATDNCTANLTITNNAPAQFAVGTTTVVWTITDASGNSVTVSQLVTVTDNQMPTIVAPANVVVDANSGCSAFNVSLGQATAQDNCGVASITNNAPVVFALGVTTVTWTATDVNGNVTTATQTVTVVDTTAPSLVAPANVTATAGANCQATVVLGNPITSDNCGSVTVTNNAPSTFPVGVTTVTWTATDAAGNSITATQTVTVIDVTAPVATAPANVSVNADANSCVATNVSLGTPVATDNCTANLTITNNAPAQFAIGTTTVVWTIVDASGNSVTVTQTVTVTDNQAPTIVAPANVTANANNSCEASNVNLGTATAADNCGTVTLTNNAPAVFPLGATTVTWTATDASGNTTTATQVVTVVDATAPSLMVSNAIQVNADSNSCFATNVNLGNFIALDNCTAVTVTNNAPASYPTGLTVVTWTATDAAGNVTTATQNVLVIDTTAPVVTPPANVSVSTDTTGCSATNVNLGNPIATDNCGIASITNDAPAQFPVGTTTVFWTATDNFGNTTTVSQTVTVTDLVAPVAQTQNITVNLSAQGTASITAMQVNNASTDNCGIASMSVSPSNFTCANLGANTVTLTVVDQSGNTSTATAVVTIADNLAPVAIANNVTVALNEQGQASITAAQVNNGSTDNCGVANISVSPTTFDCSNLGNNTVVLTVIDASGNVSTTNANVLVVDEIAPVAITKDITLNVTFEQPVTISPEDVNDGSFDNCSITSMSLSKDTFDCGDYGENIVELTVVDQSGNSSSMSLVVTVNRCTVRVSDVITPNGDGINDTWMVYNIEQYPANQVYVYNRWGDQVFTSKGYMNTWDGSYKNRGQKLPEAASYYYQIDLDGDGVIDQDGWLYITR